MKMAVRRIYAAMISTILVLTIFGAQKSAASDSFYGHRHSTFDIWLSTSEKRSKADILGLKSLKLICKNKTKFLRKKRHGLPGYFHAQENFLVLVSKKKQKIITYSLPLFRTVAEIRSDNYLKNKEKRISHYLEKVKQILNKTKNFSFSEYEIRALFNDQKIVARYPSGIGVIFYREKTIDRTTLEMTDKHVFKENHRLGRRGVAFKATHKCKITDDDNQVKSILEAQEKKWRNKAYEFVKEAKPIVQKHNERLKKRKI